MSSIQHKFIEFCIESKVLRFGEFKTKAGRLSPYFFNAGLFNTGAMLSKLADFYARTLIKAMEEGRIECDMIFGPAYKGITLAAAVAMRMKEVHGTLAALEQAMKNDDREHVAPSMCYAYAALAEGAPFIMGAPNTTVDIPAMWEMAEKTKMPIAGKDFKTGQTLVKSGFAPIIGTRCLGLSGWFSTNILGNRDGLVLDEPANFHTKEVSKLSTLESILVPENQPDLYTDYYHKVRINYYPPRNDNKEGWDNIDIFGWMGYPMQIKINFLCRDSILAAPLCLDLVLLSDLAARAGRYGIQRFLSFFLKSPMHDYTADEVPVNHLFQQYVMLKNALREMGGYEADEEID